MITPNSHKDFIYTGPSWAVQSFSTSDGYLDKETVNIGHMFANEFGLSVEWCPRMGVSNTGLCETIRRLKLPQHIPIVWIYCDPIGKIYYNKGSFNIKDKQILNIFSETNTFSENYLQFDIFSEKDNCLMVLPKILF